jgi:dTDP-4-amino-4,6-dideoxygalactose transaminase
MFYLLMPSLDARQRFIAELRAQSIHSVFHYLPLHLSPKGKAANAESRSCPVTEDVSDRLVRLPFFTTMTPTDQARVIKAVTAFRV